LVVARAVEREETRPAADAGIGEYDIEPAHLAHRVVEGAVERVAVGDVDLLACRAEPFRLGGETRGIEIEDRDLRAVIGHRLGIGEAETAGAAGDDCDESRNVEQIGRFHSARAAVAIEISAAPPKIMLIPSSRPIAHAAEPGSPTMMMRPRIKSMIPLASIQPQRPESCRR